MENQVVYYKEALLQIFKKLIKKKNMKKVIRLTESDLMRIVRRVIKESKYGSFDDKEWYDEDDRLTNVDDMGVDFDEKKYHTFDDLDLEHPKNNWFKGDSGRETFDLYKDKHKSPFKVRTRRNRD